MSLTQEFRAWLEGAKREGTKRIVVPDRFVECCRCVCTTPDSQPECVLPNSDRTGATRTSLLARFAQSGYVIEGSGTQFVHAHCGDVIEGS